MIIEINELKQTTIINNLQIVKFNISAKMFDIRLNAFNRVNFSWGF